MKNRLSNISKPITRLLCVLSACGFAYSCTDDYKLDDEKPAGLQTSIYQGLQNMGVYSTYLRLLEDPQVNTGSRSLKDVLSRTGSKTVFVANDEAYLDFFRKNATLPESDPWHTATSYEALTPAQKKLIIHCSMLNNAIVMENLASSEGSGSQRPIRGEYLRRYTDVMLTDSVQKLYDEDLPIHYNPTDKDQWARFRSRVEGDKGRGIYLVTDATNSMMVHFTNEQMKKQLITDEDFSIIMGTPRTTEDVHVYDSRITSKDQACENGYINTMDRVIKPLPNMAEVIRTNGKTNIFSHILDRFSAPYYNPSITQAYKNLYPEFKDSIFTKNYMSLWSVGRTPNSSDPDGIPCKDNDGEYALKFDPGWNEFSYESSAERDMAAMYVPDDETMKHYFSKDGAGRELMETYCKNPAWDAPESSLEDFYKKIDQIPLSTIQALVNNIMFRSFNGSVPSKMTQLRDDAQEQIFYPEDKQKIDHVLLASNGAVYVMKHVYAPADYSSVAAPAYISKDNLVMKWAIYNGANISADNPDKMGLNYYAYLKAMKSRFEFFLPSDEGMGYYYDPVSVHVRYPRVLGFEYINQKGLPIKASAYIYQTDGGNRTQKHPNYSSFSESEIVNRLKDMLESQTIVVEGNKTIKGSKNEFYLAKNGSPIIVKRNDADPDKIDGVYGGLQYDYTLEGITNGTQGSAICEVEATYSKDNGYTYKINAPIIPTKNSVYNILADESSTPANNPEMNRFNGDNPFEEFFNLCSQVNDDIICACGLVDEQSLTTEDRIRELRKYNIFVSTTGDAMFAPNYNVSFFNNFNYTVLVPSNEAVREAISEGLPTWESITADFEACEKDEEGKLTLKEDSIRLQGKITFLNNFIRYHFTDGSVFDDKEPLAEESHVTSSFDRVNGVFKKVLIKREMYNGQVHLLVKEDEGDAVWRRASDEKYKHNVLARDVFLSRKIDAATTTLSNVTIQGSSFAVIHSINGVLHHNNGKYPKWNNTAQIKRYLNRFRIR